MRGIACEYRTERANADLRLYDGPITLQFDRGEVTAQGTVELRWLPEPTVGFEIPEIPQSALPPDVGCQVTMSIPDASGRGPASLTSLSMGSHKATAVKGRIDGFFQCGCPDGLQAVDFHLVNFGHFSALRPNDAPADWRGDRMIWKSQEWCLTIDAVPGLRELEAEVKAVGGYIISHTARLARNDGGAFTGNDVREFWGLLHRFLSFVAGRRMNAILPIAFDGDGQPVWTEWVPWTIDPWKEHDSWADLHKAQEIGAVFPGFAKRRADADWNETVDLAIYWFVESNRNPLSVETNIVLTQVALERLAWEYLVRQGGMGKKKFEDMAARDKISRLFKDHGILADIPLHFTELHRHNWTDAVNALTSARNRIVHPAKKGNLKGMSLWECRQCGLWLLESLLLRLFDFEGDYSDRRDSDRCTGKVMAVPWKKKRQGKNRSNSRLLRLSECSE
jgi:hypothetical protein